MWSHVLPSHGCSLHGDSPVWTEMISLGGGERRLYWTKCVKLNCILKN